MQSVANEICLLLSRIFTVDPILSETRQRISQKFRRINSIKLNDVFFYCTCLRLFFCVERLKIDANVTNFAACFVEKTECS